MAWPGTGSFSGFLTHRNCPALSKLGITPNAPKEFVNDVFEKIITCANFYSYGSQAYSAEVKDLYILAYFELIEYLRFLFVKYDEIFTSSTWEDNINDWDWFKFLTHAATKYEEIHIFTLNYDTYLEKMITKLGENYYCSQVQKRANEKFAIYKPHGSISFVSTKEPDTLAVLPEYSIPEKFREPLSAGDIKVEHSNLGSKRLVNTIIPPFGDSGRTEASWSKLITDDFVKYISTADDVIVCGLSYWHVDRAEIDKVLLKAKTDCNIININPSSNGILNTIMASRFSKFQHYSNSDILMELAK